MMRRQQDQQSRVFYELSALVLNLLRSPPMPLNFPDHPPPPPVAVVPSRRSPSHGYPQNQITPAGFASLLLGISLALMLCGSVTFFIGFMLMPWVLGLAMVFFVAGIVSSLSVLGRSILCYATAPPTPRKDVPGKRKQIKKTLKFGISRCVPSLIALVFVKGNFVFCLFMLEERDFYWVRCGEDSIWVS